MSVWSFNEPEEEVQTMTAPPLRQPSSPWSFTDDPEPIATQEEPPQEMVQAINLDQTIRSSGVNREKVKAYLSGDDAALDSDELEQINATYGAIQQANRVPFERHWLSGTSRDPNAGFMEGSIGSAAKSGTKLIGQSLTGLAKMGLHGSWTDSTMRWISPEFAQKENEFWANISERQRQALDSIPKSDSARKLWTRKWFLENGVETTVRMVPQLAIGYMTGGTGFALYAAGDVAGATYNDAYDQARENGLTHQQAVGLASAEATVDGAVTAITSKLGFMGLEKLPGAREGQKQVMRHAMTWVARRGAGAGQEMVQEFTEGLVHNYNTELRELILDTGKYDSIEEVNAATYGNPAWWEQNLSEGVLAAIPGAAIGGGGIGRPDAGNIDIRIEGQARKLFDPASTDRDRLFAGQALNALALTSGELAGMNDVDRLVNEVLRGDKSRARARRDANRAGVKSPFNDALKAADEGQFTFEEQPDAEAILSPEEEVRVQEGGEDLRGEGQEQVIPESAGEVAETQVKTGRKISKEARDRGELTEGVLAQQVNEHRGTGGISSESREAGFKPAFRNTKTGEIYPSMIFLGQKGGMSESGVHLLDGIPSEHVTERDPEQPESVIAVAPYIEVGFERDGKFYTREEAAAETQVEPPIEPGAVEPAPSAAPAIESEVDYAPNASERDREAIDRNARQLGVPLRQTQPRGHAKTLADYIESKLGRRVVFVEPEGESAFSGLYDRRSNTLFVDAGLSEQGQAESILSHEFAHSLEGTALWDGLQKAIGNKTVQDNVAQYMGRLDELIAEAKPGSHRNFLMKTRNRLDSISRLGEYEGVAAALQDANVLHLLATQDMTLFQKLKAAFTRFLVRHGFGSGKNAKINRIALAAFEEVEKRIAAGETTTSDVEQHTQMTLAAEEPQAALKPRRDKPPSITAREEQPRKLTKEEKAKQRLEEEKIRGEVKVAETKATERRKKRAALAKAKEDFARIKTDLLARGKAKKELQSKVRKQLLALVRQTIPKKEQGRFITLLASPTLTPAAATRAVVKLNEAINAIEHKEAVDTLEETLKGFKVDQLRPEFKKEVKELVGDLTFRRMQPSTEEKRKKMRLRPADERKKIRQSTTDRLQGTMEYLRRAQKAGEEVYIPLDVLSELERLSQRNAKDLTTEELRALDAAVKHFLHLNRTKNKLISAQETRVLGESTAQVITELGPLGERDFLSTGERVPPKRYPLPISLTANLRPSTYARLLTRTEGEFYKRSYQDLADAQSEWWDVKHKAEDALRARMKELGIDDDTAAKWSAAIAKKKGIFQALKEKDLKERHATRADIVEHTLESGKTMQMTKGQRMGILASLSDMDTWKWVIDEGTPLEIPSQGQGPSIQFTLTPADVADMRADLSTEEQAVLEFVLEYINGPLKELIRAWSVKHHGYDITKEGTYYPRRRRLVGLNLSESIKELGGTVQATLASIGIVQPRTGGVSPLLVNDIFTEYYNQAWATGAIAHMDTPLRNLRKILKDPQVNDKLANSKKGRKILGYYAELELSIAEQVVGGYGGQALGEKFFRGMLDKFAVGALGVNPRVMLFQPLSLMMAAREVPVRYLMAAVKDGFNIATHRRMKEHSPWLRGRAEGGALRLVSDSAEAARQVVSKKKSLQDKLMAGISMMDSIAVNTIWRAAELQVEAEQKHEKGSDEYWAAVRKIAERVVRETQPTFDPLHISALGREAKRNKVWKLFYMFQSQRSQNRNMFVEDIMAIAKGNQQEKARAIARLSVLAVLQPLGLVAIRELTRWIEKWFEYDDKEGEEEVRNWLAKVVATDFGNVVFGDYAAHLTNKIIDPKGYHFSPTPAPLIDTLTRGTERATKAATGKGDIHDVLQASADWMTLLGVPAYVPRQISRQIRNLEE